MKSFLYVVIFMAFLTPALGEECLVVHRFDGYNSKPITTGSGFNIASDVVVTNRHVSVGGEVASKLKSGREAEVPPTFVQFGDSDPIKVKYHTFDSKSDVALLYLDDKTTATPNKVVPYVPKVGDEVKVVGYPAGEHKITTGTVKRTKAFWFFVETSFVTAKGVSGSPVLNKKGEVIGVASAIIANSDNDTTGSCLFISSNEVIRHLRDVGVE